MLKPGLVLANGPAAGVDVPASKTIRSVGSAIHREGEKTAGVKRIFVLVTAVQLTGLLPCL